MKSLGTSWPVDDSRTRKLGALADSFVDIDNKIILSFAGYKAGLREGE